MMTWTFCLTLYFNARYSVVRQAVQTAVPPYIQEWAVIFSPQRHLKSIAGGGTGVVLTVPPGLDAPVSRGSTDRTPGSR